MAEQRAVLVTGAASGIGRAVAQRFAREGWLVGMTDIAAVEEAAAAVGANAVPLTLDVRDRASWRAALATFAERSGGRLDLLVNNAGIARFGWFDAMPDAEIDDQLAINVGGVVNGCQAALPLLRATPGSRTINVASCAGLFGSPRLAVYSATKFAVRGLSEALDVEWSRFGIPVTCVMPWFVETPILDSGSAGGNLTIRDYIEQTGQPICTIDEAVDTVWAAVTGTDHAYIVGKMGRSLRFAARFMPGRLRKRLKASVA